MTGRGHGLVIGKFYPPHAGHHHLVNTAAAHSGRVTVIVMAASHESITLTDRVAWMRDTHAHDPRITVVGVRDDIPVDYDDPAIWGAHVALMESALARAAIETGQGPSAAPVDIVFTSEEYGDELARRLGAAHHPVDIPRTGHPISGTAVRADIPGMWEHLAPATRAGLALRVVVLGAESTGTTTLSLDLADALRRRGRQWEKTGWVEEYGRNYVNDLLDAASALADHAGRTRPGMEDLTWTEDDFVLIADTQNRLEQSAARDGGPILVCDTDAFTTGLWHERYVGTRSARTEALADVHRHDLYLLTSPAGVEFEQDGTRDGEHLRPWMHELFAERLAGTGRPFHVLTGSREERVTRALALVDDAAAARWSFAPPHG
jgi:NadR type nicotinamide-nucleotide adenylyltransferase